MKIGCIGTGLMGAPMAHRVLAAGHETTVYNRSVEKTEELRVAGATVGRTPAAVLERSEAVVVMVADGPAVRQVLLKNDSAEHLHGRTILQMSTISPLENQEIASEVTTRGGTYLEAPVLGSIPQASDGSLIVMVGCSEAEFDGALPLLHLFGPDPRHIGAVGAASALKLALNQLIASLTAAFSLSLAYVDRKGLDVELFMEILRSSALYAPTFDKKLQGMLERSFAKANFPARHLLKDVRLCRDEAGAVGLDTSALEAVEHIIASAIEQGHADSDYSALFEGILNPGW
jgi:3-hydroxyisobutyrate dehydrogenase